MPVYSAKERSEIREKFWIRFGQYMAPVPSSAAAKSNWINYRTGVRQLHLRMNADNNRCYIGLELSHPNDEKRARMYRQFENFSAIFNRFGFGPWVWETNVLNEHDQKISRIYQELKDINIFEEKNWPEMISFFKSRIIAFDGFWYDHRPLFEMLE